MNFKNIKEVTSVVPNGEEKSQREIMLAMMQGAPCSGLSELLMDWIEGFEDSIYILQASYWKWVGRAEKDMQKLTEYNYSSSGEGDHAESGWWH